jgi:hypothetical protein
VRAALHQLLEATPQPPHQSPVRHPHLIPHSKQVVQAHPPPLLVSWMFPWPMAVSQILVPLSSSQQCHPFLALRSPELQQQTPPHRLTPLGSAVG